MSNVMTLFICYELSPKYTHQFPCSFIPGLNLDFATYELSDLG